MKTPKRKREPVSDDDEKEDSPPVKRGPGRPRKSDTGLESPAVKRGPGRPRKSDSGAGGSTKQQSQSHNPKRGRPPKTLIKRGPGRPRKSG